MKSLALTKPGPGLAALLASAALFTSLPASAQTPSDETGEAWSDETTYDAPSEPSTDAALSEEPVNEPPPEETTDAAPLEEDAEGSEEPVRPPPAAPEAAPEVKKPFIGFGPPLKPARIENDTLSLRLGMFAQPQFEAAGAPDATKSAKNIYLRNVGLYVEGTVFDYFEYFFAVNYPNLFKVDPTNQTGGTSKNAPGLNVQDAIVTLKPFGKKSYGDALKLDAGFMLPSLSHSSLENPFTLYGLDYFVNTYRRNVLTSTDPFKSNGQSPQGRDAGAQLRGLVLGDHLEYRAGLFQGLRVGPLPASEGTEAELGSVNFFRFTGRLQVNILDAEKDFFYQGSYLGEKKILSVGGFIDFQDEYISAGGDVFLDMPLGPGVVTAQGSIIVWDGRNFIQTLPKQTAYMAQAGYTIQKLMLSPIVRFEYLDPAEPTPASPSEIRYSGGLAFWPWGHTSNFKAFYTYVKRDPAPEPFNQVNVQWQVYF